MKVCVCVSFLTYTEFALCRRLSSGHPSITDPDLLPLFSFHGLLSLDLQLEDQSSLSAAPFAHFSQLSQLKTLRLGYMCTVNISEALVACIGGATSLTSLTLRVPFLTSTALASLTTLLQLQLFDFSWSSHVTAVHMLSSLTSLENLQLSACIHVSPDELLALATGLPQLRSLLMPACDELLATHDQIRAMRPSLQVTRM